MKTVIPCHQLTQFSGPLLLEKVCLLCLLTTISILTQLMKLCPRLIKVMLWLSIAIDRLSIHAETANCSLNLGLSKGSIQVLIPNKGNFHINASFWVSALHSSQIIGPYLSFAS